MDANRCERRRLLDPDLPGLAELEQSEQRDRLLDAGEALGLLVEVEAAAAPEQRAEALEELDDRREAEAHVRERDLGRRRRESADRAGELLRVLRGDARLEG